MIYLYYHGGSENHGCEAIVRSTKKILDKALVLQTTNIESDRKYKLESIVELKDDSPKKISKTNSLLAAVYHKTHNGSDLKYIEFQHQNFFSNVKKGDICISIGGDNYCYQGQDVLAYYNKILHQKGAKTILWGCSVEPDLIKGDIAEDLASYNLIVARESYSYEALKKVNDNTVLLCDPAFQLDRKDLPLPNGFIEGNTVGINLSPLILNSELNDGITLENYIRLVEYIINETDMNIALIPHVVIEDNDDRTALDAIYSKFKDTDRICKIDDCNCEELKGYIARCRFLITARTHASIAAYSTCVPTLVAGYSVKAKGIAKDIFGTYENYVVPVQNLKNAGQLLDAFKWIAQNELSIKAHLEKFIIDYAKSILNAKDLI